MTEDDSNGFADPSEALTPSERHGAVPPVSPVPPVPLTQAQRVKLFGYISFIAEPLPGDPEHVVINPPGPPLVTVLLPLPGAPKHARVHKLIAKQFTDLWSAWRDANLLPLIITFDGAFNSRYKRGRAGLGEDALSNHSWGTAFDLNAPWNHMGSQGAALGEHGSTRELVPLAIRFGFLNGLQFHAPYQDPMHFEAYKICG